MLDSIMNVDIREIKFVAEVAAPQNLGHITWDEYAERRGEVVCIPDYTSELAEGNSTTIMWEDT